MANWKEKIVGRCCQQHVQRHLCLQFPGISGSCGSLQMGQWFTCTFLLCDQMSLKLTNKRYMWHLRIGLKMLILPSIPLNIRLLSGNKREMDQGQMYSWSKCLQSRKYIRKQQRYETSCVPKSLLRNNERSRTSWTTQVWTDCH